MTAARIALAIALLVSTPLARAQDAEKKAPIPCDVAAQEEALWCGKCRKLREKEQVADGKCKECQTVAEPLKVCVKKWIPRCGMHDQKPHLEGCCKSKFCCKFETVKAPLVFKCAGCGESARTEAGVTHKGIDHEKKLVKSCEASGAQPHGGEPIK